MDRIALDESALSSRTLTLRSGTTTYLEAGKAGSPNRGSPIVLLHGAPMTSLGFVPLMGHLAASHRVLAPDFPGFGGSEADGRFDGLEAYADFVVEFCGALGLCRPIILVCDSSGVIGLDAACRLPDVGGLIIADTAPIPLSGWAWPVKLVLRHLIGSAPIRLLNRWFNLVPWAVATLAPYLRPLDPALRRAMVSAFDTPERRDRVLDVFTMMGMQDEYLARTAATVRERLWRVPALILFGQFDPMRMVGGVARYESMFHDSTVAILPHEEHFAFLASAQRCAEHVLAWSQGLGQENRVDG